MHIKPYRYRNFQGTIHSLKTVYPKGKLVTGCLVYCPNRSIYCLHQITTDDGIVSTSHQNAIGNMHATYGSTYGSYKGEPNPTQVISTWVGLGYPAS